MYYWIWHVWTSSYLLPLALLSSTSFIEMLQKLYKDQAFCGYLKFHLSLEQIFLTCLFSRKLLFEDSVYYNKTTDFWSISILINLVSINHYLFLFRKMEGVIQQIISHIIRHSKIFRYYFQNSLTYPFIYSIAI